MTGGHGNSWRHHCGEAESHPRSSRLLGKSHLSSKWHHLKPQKLDLKKDGKPTYGGIFNVFFFKVESTRKLS